MASTDQIVRAQTSRQQVSTSDLVSLPLGGQFDERLRSTIFDSRELNLDLRWPVNVDVWETLRYDPQVHGLLQAIKLPIKRTGRLLTGDDVSEEVMNAVKAELGIEDGSKGRRRRRSEGIVFDVFLEEALTAFIFGHSVFEQVYALGDPLPGQPEGKQIAHISKLAYIHSKVIENWSVERNGSLRGIQVQVFLANGMPDIAWIPIENLVVFTQDRLGANWWGQSLFRPLYKPWYLKDVAERVGAMAIERGAMGIPWIKYGGNGTKAGADLIGRNMRAGEQAFVSTSMGDYEIEILGARSAELVDPQPFIEMMKRDMSKAWMAQVMDLGHSVGLGSGNLSETFLDFMSAGINALCEMYEEVITEHVIRDFVELNWGPDEAYPVFKFAPVTPKIAGDVLAQLVNAGLITPDEDVEKALRDRYGLPELKDGGRDAFAQQQADQAASAAKAMADAVPPVAPGGGGSAAGPKASKLSDSPISSDEPLLFFNPNHDHLGRFAPSGGAGAAVDIVSRDIKAPGLARLHTVGGAAIFETDGFTLGQHDRIPLSDTEITTIASTLNDLHARFPTGETVGVVAHDPVSMGTQAMKHRSNVLTQASGFVDREGSPETIHLNMERLRNSYGQRPEPGHLMPSRINTHPLVYIPTHEYGHSHDGLQQRKVGMKVQQAKKTALFTQPEIKGSLSRYGLTNIHEAYAEAFAEWALTRGKTSNVAAQTYAQVFGWPA